MVHVEQVVKIEVCEMVVIISASGGNGEGYLSLFPLSFLSVMFLLGSTCAPGFSKGHTAGVAPVNVFLCV